VTHLTNGQKNRLSGTLPDSRFLIRESVVLLAGSAANGGFRRFPMRRQSAQQPSSV